MKLLKTLLLPLQQLANLSNTRNNWNIINVGFGGDNHNQIVVNKTELRVFYPKGSYCPSKKPIGGIGIYASPKEIFMTEHVVFKYEILFDKTFDPVLGGKLPGLFIGNGTTKNNVKGASGGKHNDNASCRIVWRKNFDVEAYVYLPNYKQDSSYSDIPNLVKNNVYGDSLWRGIFKFNKTEWNSVEMRIKMNSIDINNIPEYNGELEITINNVTQSFKKMIWRKESSYNLNAIVFETFFGGSTSEWATPNDTFVTFRNVIIQKWES